MPDETPGAATPQPDGIGPEIVAAIQRLAFALRVRRFYPADSPVLARKTEETHQAFRLALRHGTLSLDIHPEEIGWTAPGGEYRRIRDADLAGTLHRRCVARIRVEPGIGTGSIHALLEDMATARDPGADASSPLLAGEIQGLHADPLELDALFVNGTAKVSRQEIWNRVLGGFSEMSGGVDSWSQVARDVPTLTRFLEWALTPESQPADLRRYAQTDAFGLLCEQIVSIAVEEPKTVFETLTAASVALFDKLDPEAWLEIFADPLQLEIGPGEAVQADLTEAIGRALSSEQVSSLVRYALRTRSRGTPRLYRFFDRVLRDRPDREPMVASLMRQLPHADTPAFAKAWPQFMKVMLGENIDPYVNSDYRTTLDEATAPAEDEAPLWDLASIRTRAGEMDVDFTLIRKARIAFALLSRETVPDDYRLLLGAVEETVPVVVSRGEFDFLEAIVSTLAQHSVEGALPAEMTAAARESRAQLQQPELIRALAARLSSGSAEEFHILWRIIDQLGPDCVPQLVEALATRSSPAYRAHLTRMLGQVGELPIGVFQAALETGKPGYARDITAILVELRRAELAPVLLIAARHADPGVRREAICGLVRLPGPDSERVILDALADPALEVRVAALKSFRSTFSGDGRRRLHRYLSLGNVSGKNNTVIVAAIKAAVQLDDRDAMPRIAHLARRPLLFRKRRLAVWREAQRALDAFRDRLSEGTDADAFEDDDSKSESLAA